MVSQRLELDLDTTTSHNQFNGKFSFPLKTKTSSSDWFPRWQWEIGKIHFDAKPTFETRYTSCLLHKSTIIDSNR